MHERENGNEKANATEKRIGTHPRVPHTSPFNLEIFVLEFFELLLSLVNSDL